MCITNGNLHESKTTKVVSRVRKNPIVTGTLKQLYVDKDETGDVCFIIGSERIRAHRCVLAAVSSKYKTQFYGPQPDIGDIKVFGSTASAFRSFIGFFYLDELSLTTEDIEGVLVLAKQSLVDEFVKFCVDVLMEIITLDNVFLGYRLATLYDIDELKQLCELLIKNDTVKVFKSEDFIINCDRDLFLSILKLDTLNCRETEAFDACIYWAKAACKRRNVDPDRVENLRFELGDVITQIRFGSMSIKEFAIRQRSYEQMFTKNETNEIIYLIGRLKNFKSEKFNQTPRNQELQSIADTSETFNQNQQIRIEKELQRISHLECDRVLSDRPDYFVHGYETTYLTFYCDHAIRLDGFTVGCCNFEHLTEPVLNFNDMKTTRKFYYKLKVHENATTVLFNKPVDIAPNEKVGILCSLSKVQMLTSYELATRITAGELTFFFLNKPDGRVDNYITKLLYNLK